MTYKQFCLWGIGIWLVGMFTGWNLYYDFHQTPPQAITATSTQDEVCYSDAPGYQLDSWNVTLDDCQTHLPLYPIQP